MRVYKTFRGVVYRLEYCYFKKCYQWTLYSYDNSKAILEDVITKIFTTVEDALKLFEGGVIC